MCQLCHVATRFEGQALPVSGKESATVDHQQVMDEKPEIECITKEGGLTVFVMERRRINSRRSRSQEN
jgi:hypothetical protein